MLDGGIFDKLEEIASTLRADQVFDDDEPFGGIQAHS